MPCEHFVARDAGFTIEDDCLTFGVATSACNAEHYLMFQISLSPEEFDDGIYCEIDGQEHGFFGGLQQVTVTPAALYIQISPQTAAKARIPNDLSIGLDLADHHIQLLKRLLNEHLQPTVPVAFEGFR